MIDKLQGLYVATFDEQCSEAPSEYLRLVRHLEDWWYLAKRLDFASQRAELELAFVDLKSYGDFLVYETQDDMLNDWREKYQGRTPAR